MIAQKNNNFLSYLDQLTDLLDNYLAKKAPSLPLSWKGFIVKILPWFTLITLILAVPLILAFLGINFTLIPFGSKESLGTGLNFFIPWLVLVISSVLYLLALKGLFKNSKQGWTYFYLGVLLNGVYNLFTLNLGSLVIETGLSLYILFQIRNHYK